MGGTRKQRCLPLDAGVTDPALPLHRRPRALLNGSAWFDTLAELP